MGTFAYTGRNRQGVVKKGEVSARTRDEAMEQLRRQNIVVMNLDETVTKE